MQIFEILASVAFIGLIIIAIMWFFTTGGSLKKNRLAVLELWEPLSISIAKRFNLLKEIKPYIDKVEDEELLDEILLCENSYAISFQEQSPYNGAIGNDIFEKKILPKLSRDLGVMVSSKKVTLENAKYIQKSIELSRADMTKKSEEYNKAALAFNVRINRFPNNLAQVVFSISPLEIFTTEDSRND